MGTLFWIAGAIIAATVVLILVFGVSLICSALRGWYHRRHAAGAEQHVPLQ